MVGRIDRTLAVDGLRNARDLGGLRRRCGALTPTGVFYRSENIDAVTAEGWNQLLALGVRTVVDLRQDGERGRDVNGRPGWLTTRSVDLDGLDNTDFWRDYRGNGLAGTALYYLPHLAAMPERAGAALTAIATAPPGGVLFHCMAGRDRTGLITLLLLAAVETDPDAIVHDYLEAVRCGTAVPEGDKHITVECSAEAVCREHGTTTEGAFRQALDGLDIDAFMSAAELDDRTRAALRSWRGAIAV